ncbi:CRISPR-associated endonuclease Cas2 [Massilia sp. W12]|uniref:CRISPR-associated endonuclease Cas2 n=1 Tax=Massilia sp. W12 TaxID=3126507 RepID=UPI0030CAD8F1
MLSGYRIMWLLVMFDLPVLSKVERKAANDFRHALQDIGFEMVQLSVYARFCASQKQMETLCGKIQSNLPPGGQVSILQFTDKQYERILCFQGGAAAPPQEAPEQFALF